MQIFSAKYLFDGEYILENKAVIIENNIIQDVVELATINKNECKYLGDGIITPGFIDLQLNGCGGVLFNTTINQATLETMYQTCLQYGTTSFLPTLITSEFANIELALKVVQNWFSQFNNLRGVIGIHIEGPFISKDKKGIHLAEYIRKPDAKLLELITNYTKYFSIKMTLAPEMFTLDQIRFLHNASVILSIGHSNASYRDAIQGISCGITTATHMFNTMSGLTGRNPGVIGAVLNTDIYAGIIADLYHVDPANMELTYKIKRDKLYLVTDAVTPMGTAMTEFELVGQKLFVKDGRCVDKNDVLGGANITMNESIRNCVESCHIPLESALKMASLTPAKVMGLDNRLGRIKKDYRADLVYMNLDDYSCTIL